MTALSNTYRIRSFDSSPTTGLNNQYSVMDNWLVVVDNQSLLFKAYDFISPVNRLEIQKVRSFAELEQNWDSYDAQKISPDAIAKSVDLIKEIDKLDEEIYFSSPGPNGEVMIQLKKAEKEVEIIQYANKSKYVTFSKEEFEKQGDFTLEILPEIIEWLNI
ncbi:MAG: hypothetical protein ACI837_003218 [Crocinitomicaceae bacterium]|jgi:hypothetical protein